MSSELVKKALKKQHCRAKKVELKNKAAREKRQPPTNKPEHSIKKSHKPRALSSVKNTCSYKDLTREIEKVRLERDQYHLKICYWYEMQRHYQDSDGEEENDHLWGRGRRE